MHDAVAQWAWHNQFWTDFLRHIMALDSLLNIDLPRVSTLCGVTVAVCTWTEWQTFLNFDVWSSEPHWLWFPLEMQPVLIWVILLTVEWCDHWSIHFLNLFWRSKIRESGLAAWYFENIKYIDIMWYISKYHDIFDILIVWNIMIFSHLQ